MPYFRKDSTNGVDPSTSSSRLCRPQYVPSEIMERVTLLYRAIEAGDESTVKSILSLYQVELDPNSNLPGLPMPLLHLAVGLSENTIEIVDILLDKGGNPNNLATEDNVSPMHLSVIYDYNEVLAVLMKYGGDPAIPNGDGKSCYDLVKDNVEREMKERCFLFLYRRCTAFRKSIMPSDRRAMQVLKRESTVMPTIISSPESESASGSGSDGFVTCDSDFEAVEVANSKDHEDSVEASKYSEQCSPKVVTLSGIQEEEEDPEHKLCVKFTYLMTEDESSEDSHDDTDRRLSTIAEEPTSLPLSSISQFTHTTYQPVLYEETNDESSSSNNNNGKNCSISTIYSVSSCSAISPDLGISVNAEDISNATTTSSTYTNLDQDSTSNSISTDASGPSCTNSTPPILPPPTKGDIIALQRTLKESQISYSETTPANKCTIPIIPVTATTFNVLNRLARTDEKKLVEVMTPKPGTASFSPELTSAMFNLHVLEEWGNLKIEIIQSLANTPSKKQSKSFYNYLLLDTRVTKRVNFSGAHLKSNVIRNTDKFETFLKAVFYIGKGCGKRPIQHLVDAKAVKFGGRGGGGGFGGFGPRSVVPTPAASHGDKVDKILEIWKSGLGVTVVSIFHYSCEKEANVNEASMIDAIGLVELSNMKKGSYNGTVASLWTQKAKNQLGSFLLYKSFCAFAVGEHRALHAQDV